jgi:hypothetical protein
MTAMSRIVATPEKGKSTKAAARALADHNWARLPIRAQRTAAKAKGKRVASAVGEGSVVVHAVHARLADLRQPEVRKSVTL